MTEDEAYEILEFHMGRMLNIISQIDASQTEKDKILRELINKDIIDKEFVK